MRKYKFLPFLRQIFGGAVALRPCPTPSTLPEVPIFDILTPCIINK